MTAFPVRTTKLRATFVHATARLGDEIRQREVAQAIVTLNEGFLRRFEAGSIVVAQADSPTVLCRLNSWMRPDNFNCGNGRRSPVEFSTW